MKVALKKVMPNPFRNLPHYPIDQDKIRKLKSSIKRTGFWDNIVGRVRSDGKFEIGYGHHRRVALREIYPGTHKIGVICRKLDDATMIKIMADENDEIYNLSPAVINETVKAARDYLRAHPEEKIRARAHQRAGQRGRPEASVIADFLAWDQHRVEEALAELAAIEAGHLEKQAIEQMPSQKAAQAFRKQVKRHKASPSAQREVAARLHSGQIGTKDIPREIIQATLPKKKGPKLIRFEQFLEEGAAKITAAGTFLVRLEKHRADFHGDIYRSSIERSEVESACERFFSAYQDVFTKGARNGKGHPKRLQLSRG